MNDAEREDNADQTHDADHSEENHWVPEVLADIKRRAAECPPEKVTAESKPGIKGFITDITTIQLGRNPGYPPFITIIEMSDPSNSSKTIEIDYMHFDREERRDVREELIFARQNGRWQTQANRYFIGQEEPFEELPDEEDIQATALTIKEAIPAS